MTLIFRAQRAILPDRIGPAAIYVDGGRIRAIRDYDDIEAGAPVLTIAGILIPGLVDTHVHINDPGRSTWEGFASATRAAASGGVTTVVDMPLNSIPATTTLDAIHKKVRALEGNAHVDVGLCGGLVPANADRVGELFSEGLIAFKCFLAESGVNEFSHVNAAELERGLRSLDAAGAPLFVHAELPEPLEEAAARLGIVTPEAARRYVTYLASRPKSAEDAAVELVYSTLRAVGGRGHIVHLSSADALPILRRAADEGIALTAETCPHYLTLAAEDIPDGDTAFKCAPPIRERSNQELLWKALSEGLIAQVVTDHSPSTLDLKCSSSGDFMKAWGGISSLELGLAVVAQAAAARGIAFEHVVRQMSAAPARLAGLNGRKGELCVGADADFAEWDPEAVFVVDALALQHKNPITPYAAQSLKGRVVRTFLRGEEIFSRNSDHEGTSQPHFSAPRGTWLRRPL
jgi:allantoinase